MTHYIPENNVYVYFRYTDNKTVMDPNEQQQRDPNYQNCPFPGKNKRIQQEKIF
jgi:hypothetical protein